MKRKGIPRHRDWLLARLAAAVLVFVSLHPACAAKYQVGPARGYTNLQAVANLLLPGDVVEVDGDATYPGGVSFDQSGTESRPIIVRGLRVDGKRPVIAGVSGKPGAAVVRIRGNHYLFEGFDVTAGGDPLTGRGVYNVADHVTVRDTVVHDCPCTGVSGAAVAGSFMLDGVEIYHCGRDGRAHQIYVESDNAKHPNAVFRMQYCYLHDGSGGNNVKSRVGRNEIYYNWIEGSPFHELDLIGADPSDQAHGAAHKVREDSDVVGNVFFKTAKSQGALARLGSDGTGASNGRYRFVNNTVVFDPAASVQSGIFKISGFCESLEIDNNVFYRGGKHFTLIRDMRPQHTKPLCIVGSNNWVPKGSTVRATLNGTIYGLNPGFADVSDFDFTPTAKSPLVDAGHLPTESPPDVPFPNPLQTPRFLPPPRRLRPPDMVVARPQNGEIDIGAFEFSSNKPAEIHGQ